MDKLEPSHIAEGTVNCTHLWKINPTVPQNVKYGVTTRSRNSTSRYIPKRNENFMFTQNLVHKCSQQQYSQREKRNNSNIHQQMSGLTKCDIHV